MPVSFQTLVKYFDIINLHQEESDEKETLAMNLCKAFFFLGKIFFMHSIRLEKDSFAVEISYIHRNEIQLCVKMN